MKSTELLVEQIRRFVAKNAPHREQIMPGLLLTGRHNTTTMDITFEQLDAIANMLELTDKSRPLTKMFLSFDGQKHTVRPVLNTVIDRDYQQDPTDVAVVMCIQVTTYAAKATSLCDEHGFYHKIISTIYEYPKKY